MTQTPSGPESPPAAPAPLPRPLSKADYCLLASCVLLFASIVCLAVIKKVALLWGVAGALWLVHVCWCWVLAREYWRPVRASLWLVWFAIGCALVLGCAGPAFSLYLRSMLEWVATKGDQTGQPAPAPTLLYTLAQGVGIFCGFGVMAMAIYPPFVLGKARSDRVLFLMLLFQLPGVVLVAMDLIVGLMPGPDGTQGVLMTEGTLLGLAAGLAPVLPTVYFLGVLRFTGRYGATPRE